MVELYNKIEAYAQEAHMNQQESKCDSLTKALSQLNLNSFEAVYLHIYVYICLSMFVCLILKYIPVVAHG